jgi:hypothetical protein
LVGEGDLRGHQVVAPAHQRAQGLDGVGLRFERGEAMAVGAQDVGEDVSVAWIALGAGRPIPRPAGFDDVGVNGRDQEAGLDQGIDQEPRGALDGDGRVPGAAALAQAGGERGQTFAIVSKLEAIDNGAGGVEYADGVGGAAPIQANEKRHEPISSNQSMIPCAGRLGGVLINRRSGLNPTAHLPVARLGRPAAVAPLVSCGLSKSERARRSRQRPGTNALPAKLSQRLRELA